MCCDTALSSAYKYPYYKIQNCNDYNNGFSVICQILRHCERNVKSPSLRAKRGNPLKRMTYLHFYVTIYSTKLVRDNMKKLFASKKSLSAITILGGRSFV